MEKTGECYYRDDNGYLWLAESYMDDDGVVTTQSIQIEPPPKKPKKPAADE